MYKYRTHEHDFGDADALLKTHSPCLSSGLFIGGVCGVDGGKDKLHESNGATRAENGYAYNNHIYDIFTWANPESMWPCIALYTAGAATNLPEPSSTACV